MKKIGNNINLRVSLREKGDLDYLALLQQKTRSALIREIVQEYTERPEPITLVLVERVKKALVNREVRLREEKGQVLVTMPLYLSNSLKLLSEQTGVSVESLISLMVSGHMQRWRTEARNKRESDS